MIFLVHYDRSTGELVEIREYAEHDKERAAAERLALEIQLLTDGIRREVVLLEAESLDALRRTHNRYFRNVSDLAKSVRAANRLPEADAED